MSRASAQTLPGSSCQRTPGAALHTVSTYRVRTVSLHELIDGDVILVQFGACVVPPHDSFPGWEGKQNGFSLCHEEQSWRLLILSWDPNLRLFNFTPPPPFTWLNLRAFTTKQRTAEEKNTLKSESAHTSKPEPHHSIFLKKWRLTIDLLKHSIHIFQIIMV